MESKSHQVGIVKKKKKATQSWYSKQVAIRLYARKPYQGGTQIVPSWYGKQSQSQQAGVGVRSH